MTVQEKAIYFFVVICYTLDVNYDKEVVKMLLKLLKRVLRKGGILVMRALPFVTTAMLVIHTNSTACVLNGQPKPPESLKKYRKF